MNKTELKKEIESHNKRNAELVDVLKKKGLSNADEVDAEYHFWAFNQDDAVALAKDLYERAFTVLVISPVEENGEISWNVEAKNRAPVNQVVSIANTEYLVHLANDHDSIYDGWGTRI